MAGAISGRRLFFPWWPQDVEPGCGQGHPFFSSGASVLPVLSVRLPGLRVATRVSQKGGRSEVDARISGRRRPRDLGSRFSASPKGPITLSGSAGRQLAGLKPMVRAVARKPRQMALTLIRSGAKSKASSRVTFTTAPFEAQSAGSNAKSNQTTNRSDVYDAATQLRLPAHRMPRSHPPQRSWPAHRTS